MCKKSFAANVSCRCLLLHLNFHRKLSAFTRHLLSEFTDSGFKINGVFYLQYVFSFDLLFRGVGKLLSDPAKLFRLSTFP